MVDENGSLVSTFYINYLLSITWVFESFNNNLTIKNNLFLPFIQKRNRFLPFLKKYGYKFEHCHTLIETFLVFELLLS